MEIKEQLTQDIKTALKKGDAVRTGTLRMLLAALVNKEKEVFQKIQGKEVKLTKEVFEQVVATEAKKRREAAEAFEKGGRLELAEKEKAELKVLLPYLPEQLSEEEVRKLVQEAIQKTGAADTKDMGKVMAELASQVKGKADGSLVSRLVREKLS